MRRLHKTAAAAPSGAHASDSRETCHFNLLDNAKGPSTGHVLHISSTEGKQQGFAPDSLAALHEILPSTSIGSRTIQRNDTHVGVRCAAVGNTEQIILLNYY